MFAEGIVKLFSILRKGTWGLVPVLILVLYTYFGALIFQAIERPHELKKLNRSLEYHVELLQETAKQLSRANSNLTFILEQLQVFRNAVANDSYLNELSINNNTGVYKHTDVFKWTSKQETKWSIWGAIYYSMTIYTTIGYGNIFPETWGGKLVTVIYGLIGIPLALISLIALGSLLARFWLWIWLLLVRAVGCLSRDLEKTVNAIVPVDEAHESLKSNNDDNHEELIRFPLSFLLFLVLFWILFSAALFNWWLEHQWSFAESLYFILISFMTIGFGDYIPSKYDYIIVVGFLLLGGLALISAVITILQKQIGAIAASMKEYIDKEIVEEINEFLQEITEIHMENLDEKAPTDDSQEKIIVNNKKRLNSINVVVKEMAWRRRAVYNIMMSKERKKQLEDYMKMRLKRVNRGTQTDPEVFRNSLPVVGMRQMRQEFFKNTGEKI